MRRLSAASGLDPAELFRLTGGNPFYITEVLQAGMRAVPAAARDAVLARVARLGAPARELLDVAALLGTRVEPELIQAIAPGSAGLLDEILASGLLAEDGRWLRFRHEIARLSCEQAIAAHRRGPIHRRILGALASSAAWTTRASPSTPKARATGPRRSATRRPPRGGPPTSASHQEAAAQYQRAVRFAAEETRHGGRALRRRSPGRPRSSTAGRRPSKPERARSSCGARSVTRCARATR